MSLYLAYEGFQVTAFEPDIRLRHLYETNLGSYLRSGQVEVYNVAISDEDREEREFLLGNGIQTLEPEIFDSFPDRRTHEIVTVAAERLSTFLSRSSRIVSFIKIDAEGHDHKVLRGLFDRTVINKPGMIMFEANEGLLNRAEECLAILRKNGYKRFRAFIRCGSDLVEDVTFTKKLPWPDDGKQKYANIVGYL